MSVQQIPPGGATTVQPLGATGTYTLSVPLSPGLYRITTDTTQTFTAAQLYFPTVDGFRFGAVIRGGQGYVALPVGVTQVVLTAGTFPLLLGFQKFSTYNLIDAPVATISWLSSASFAAASDWSKAVISYTVPPGSTGVGFYSTNGNFTDLGGVSSPQTITLPGGTDYSGYITGFAGGTTRKILFVSKDVNGVWGKAAEVITPVYPFYIYNNSGVYTPPVGSNTADVLVGAGGGAGGGTATINHNEFGSGGGGGGVHFASAVVTSGSVTVTVGAQGVWQNPAVTGGTSNFSAINCGGGGQGYGWNGNGGTPLVGIAGAAGTTKSGGSGGINSNSTGTAGAGAGTYYGLAMGQGNGVTHFSDGQSGGGKGTFGRTGAGGVVIIKPL